MENQYTTDKIPAEKPYKIIFPFVSADSESIFFIIPLLPPAIRIYISGKIICGAKEKVYQPLVSSPHLLYLLYHHSVLCFNHHSLKQQIFSNNL